jgi:hypothetical protein
MLLNHLPGPRLQRDSAEAKARPLCLVEIDRKEEPGMGVTYNVISAGVVGQHAFAVESLRYYDIVPPSASEPGRNPSPQQLRAVLDELPGYKADYFVSPGNWQASVEATTGWRLFRSETLISVVDFRGDETMPHLFYFDKGDPRLNILIVERLSRLCGLATYHFAR